MFSFHSIIFCIIYLVTAFCFLLGLFFKIVFRIVDEKKIVSHNVKFAIVYISGIGISAFTAYYLFQFVYFVQQYY